MKATPEIEARIMEARGWKRRGDEIGVKPLDFRALLVGLQRAGHLPPGFNLNGAVHDRTERDGLCYVAGLVLDEVVPEVANDAGEARDGQ